MSEVAELTVLFQGDSITDAGRTANKDPNVLGGGYPLFVNAMFHAENPGRHVRFINRGISGNRARDLRARWEKDCIDLHPDILSILIGINDTWRRYDSNDPTTPEKFEEDYRWILDRTRTALPNTEIVILEPFLLPEPADKQIFREDLDPKIHVARRLAAEFQTQYIPLDGIFAAAAIASGSQRWSGDGVHPSHEGHALIAEHWLESVDL